MEEIFKKRKIDLDTQVIQENPLKIKEYNCLHEIWKWEAIKGESIIFLTSEVDQLGNDVLEDLVNDSGLVTSPIFTHSRGDVFTYVNFNFKQ